MILCLIIYETILVISGTTKRYSNIFLLVLREKCIATSNISVIYYYSYVMQRVTIHVNDRGEAFIVVSLITHPHQHDCINIDSVLIYLSLNEPNDEA